MGFIENQIDSLMMPVMANRLPWNELVLQGRRIFKTIHFNWKHRGKVLLYSSKSTDWGACSDYLIDAADLTRGHIIGYATVVDVAGSDRDFEVELRDPKRFKKPIPFKPPRGAIRLFKAPKTFLRRATV